MICWPAVGDVYSRLHRAGATFVLGSFGPNGIVEFKKLNGAGNDVEVRFYNTALKDERGRVMSASASYNCRVDVYMYMAFLIALIVATPIPIRRKLWALLWGGILIHCFIFLRLAGHIFEQFSREPLCLFTISPFWQRTFDILYQQFIVNVNFGFVVAVFIWILVTFRREDWSKIVSGKGQESEVTNKVLKRRTSVIGVGA